MDKLICMRTFASVARLGSFSAAADELGVSKAMASKYINALESELNVRLINRTTRQLSLTEAGMAYRDRINTILQDIEETESSVTSLQTEPRGHLKIMAPPSFGSFHLARAFQYYRERYPEVDIDLTLTDREPDIVEDGIDLAVVLGPQPDSSLVSRLLATSRIVVCGSPQYFSRNGIPQTPDDLVNHNCLRITNRSPLATWKFMIDDKLVTLLPSGNLTTNTADPLRVAAIHGLGLVQLPSYIVGNDIKEGRLRPVLEKFEPTELPIQAVFIHRRFLSAKVRSFVEFIHERFQPEPYWDNWIKDR